MKISVKYEFSIDDATAVIYAMNDSTFEFSHKSAEKRDDVMNAMKECIKKYGDEFDDYLVDVCSPNISYTEAYKRAGLVFPELRMRQATNVELRDMESSVREIYKSGGKVVRVPDFLIPKDKKDGPGPRFYSYWPQWIEEEDYQNYCHFLKK